ncbi:hypothetical protein E2C01_050174 [Portunus trituberculatus]|uniref:Uncharacterized protein n=1 Tax=Portunus trituberculatus TaxID=210409 RepID=A0A5B7G8A4_PORTR|nr:hypothetical protein [Portunus trituberculatus]
MNLARVSLDVEALQLQRGVEQGDVINFGVRQGGGHRNGGQHGGVPW